MGIVALGYAGGVVKENLGRSCSAYIFINMYMYVFLPSRLSQC